MPSELEMVRANVQIRANKALEALGLYIDEYVSGYEFVTDEGDHSPSTEERVVIQDAIDGLLASDEFIAKIEEWLDFRAAARGLCAK